MIDEQDVKDWEQLPLVSSVLTSPHMGAWLYYRDQRRDKRVRAEVIDEFVRWAYVHGIDFSFMGKIKDDGTSDVPERLQKIKDEFWEQLKEYK